MEKLASDGTAGCGRDGAWRTGPLRNRVAMGLGGMTAWCDGVEACWDREGRATSVVASIVGCDLDRVIERRASECFPSLVFAHRNF